MVKEVKVGMARLLAQGKMLAVGELITEMGCVFSVAKEV